MANIGSWNKDMPSGISQLRHGDDLLRSHWSSLQAAWEEQHYFTDGSAASGGRHKLGSARIYSGTSSQVSSIGEDGGLMWNSTDSTLHALHSASTTTIPSLASANTWTAAQTFSAAVTMSSTLAVTGASAFGGATASHIGVYVRGTVPHASGSANGVYSNPTFDSGVTGGTGVGAQITTAASAFTLTNAYTLRAFNPTVGAGSAITNAYGLYVDAISAGTNNYAIYTNAGDVRFGGAVTAASTLSVTGVSTLTGDVVAGVIRRGTSDGADNSFLALAGGGGISTVQGGRVLIYGNEHAQTGIVSIEAGNVTGGGIQFLTSNATRGSVSDAGAWTFNTAVSLSSTLSVTGIINVGGTRALEAQTATRLSVGEGFTDGVMIHSASRLLVGTTVTTSAGSGEVVLPQEKYLRSVNAAGTGTFSLIGGNANGHVAIGGGYSGNGCVIAGTGFASFPAAGASHNGLLLIDTTNNRLVVYINGSRYPCTMGAAV